MVYYTETKPTVYLETTVVSYLAARPSRDVAVASMQQITQQLWQDYSDKFTFVVSPIVITEVDEGDADAVKRRCKVISELTTLEVLPEADFLSQKLLDVGAIPQNFSIDAQHIAIATTHGVEYLLSWNQKHIVNEHKLEHIKQVCLESGFEPITICTPAELIERYLMKEKDLKDYTDPILEECYRVKRELSARFNTVEELSAHLREVQEECRRQGMKIVSYYVPPSERKKGVASTGGNTLDETSKEDPAIDDILG